MIQKLREKTGIQLLLAALFLTPVLPLTGCASVQEGAEEVEDEAEDVGEDVEDAAEEAGDEIEDATDPD